MAIAATLLFAAIVGGWFVRARAQGGPRSEAETRVAADAVADAVPDAVPERPSRARDSAVTSTAPAPRRAPIPQGRADKAAKARLSRTDTDAPLSRSAIEVYTVHPDVSTGPVEVVRSTDDLHARAPAAEPIEPPDAGAQAGLRDRLARAQQRRASVANRVAGLRARTNVPVIRDLDGYERAQSDLSSALDDLDRADAEVARLRRLLGGRD